MKPTEKEINKNITEKILENNTTISKLAKENERLFRSLRNRLEIPQEKIERYREELASDNWKNYSKKLVL
jgi:SOS response regulatory protein OraA/RecX